MNHFASALLFDLFTVVTGEKETYYIVTLPLENVSVCPKDLTCFPTFFLHSAPRSVAMVSKFEMFFANNYWLWVKRQINQTEIVPVGNLKLGKHVTVNLVYSRTILESKVSSGFGV